MYIASIIVKMNRRTLREIKKGMESKQFEFFCDDEGKYGELGACYLRFVPEDEIYCGQTHILKIKFSYGSNEVMEYPTNPPNIRFLTPIWHSNIGKDGIICLDILKIDEKWKSSYGIDAVFQSLCLLLIAQNPKDPLNGSAAKDYNNMTPIHYREIADVHYAQGISTDYIQKLLNSSDFV